MRTAADLLRLHGSCLPRDLDEWTALFAEDGVLEMPYGESAGLPVRLVGPAQIAELGKLLVGGTEGLRFSEPEITPGPDPDDVWGEYTGEARVLANGRTYRQHYVARLRSREGKIVLLREFFDPVRVGTAFA